MGIIIATLIVVVAIASALAQDFSIFSWAYWQEGGTNTSRSEVFRNFGLASIALGALVVGSWRAVLGYMQAQASQQQAAAANEQARIAEQGQFTERFSRAAEQLGSGQLPVRLGGIYALWRLASDSPERDVVPVIDILCAFVRDPPPAEPPRTRPSTETVDMAQPGQDSSDATTRFRPDVQAALQLLGDRAASYRQYLPAEYRLDLTGANLIHAEFIDADFMSADLMGADLTDANLSLADITDAGLMNANLTHARLIEADLTTVGLAHANLTGAYLWGANLTRATLVDAVLTDADLARTNFTGANLTDADFTGADFSGAELRDAKNLTQQQLDGIRYDPDYPPKLPLDLVLPKPL